MNERGSPDRKPTDDEVDAYALTHIGKVRKENQDHFLLATIHNPVRVISTSLPASQRPPESGERIAFVAMVADGVGSGTGGGEASATAVEAIMRFVNDSMSTYLGKPPGELDFTAALQEAATRSHKAILARREKSEHTGTMATTLTMYMGVWPIYYLLQVGDSRHYLYRHGTLTQITRDQTMAQELVDSGVMSRATASKSRLAHVLSSALGAEETMPVVTRLKSDWNNVHLLCSDGLTKHVTDERIAEILGAMTCAKQACELLLQEALDDGGTDNVTIMIGRTKPREAP